MEGIFKYIDANRKYYIYGSANFGRYCYKRITERYGTDSIIGFIETIPRASHCFGKEIFSPKDVKIEKNVSVLITSFKHVKRMCDTLLKLGFEKKSIVIPENMRMYFETLNDIDIQNVKSVLFWPKINDLNTDLVRKIRWFIPDRIDVKVCSSNAALSRKWDNIKNFDEIALDVEMQSVDLIYIWDAKIKLHDIAKFRDKVYIVDPTFYGYIEILNYRNLYYNSFSHKEKETFVKQSIKVFEEMKLKFKKRRRANIFCSGSSIMEVLDNDYRGDFNIICNSMVKDKEFLKNINPSLLCFTDAIFYMSPTEYAKKFFKDVIDALEKYELYIAVCDFAVPLLIKHYPVLEKRIIGMPRSSMDLVFPSTEKFNVKIASNIFTELMIPIASSLCDEIRIAGCTGRKREETYFWKHNERTQYLDLMQSVFEAYPANFRDQSYSDYYEMHCHTIERMLEYGESLGKKYVNMTTSYIPALKKRSEG